MLARFILGNFLIFSLSASAWDFNIDLVKSKVHATSQGKLIFLYAENVFLYDGSQLQTDHPGDGTVLRNANAFCDMSKNWVSFTYQGAVAFSCIAK